LRNPSYAVRYATTLDWSACIWNVRALKMQMLINCQDRDIRIKAHDELVWSMNASRLNEF